MAKADTDQLIKNIIANVAGLKAILGASPERTNTKERKFIFDMVHGVEKSAVFFRETLQVLREREDPDLGTENFEKGIKVLDYYVLKGCDFIKEDFHE